MSMVPSSLGADPNDMVKKLVASITAAGPDAYDRATTTTADAKQALLAAVAAGGSAGKAEYDRQAAQSTAAKTTALQAALAAAASRGAPQATQDAISAQISRPYDEAASARDSASANWQNYFNAQGTAGGAYLDRVSAAIPQQQQQARNTLAQNLNHDYQASQGTQATAKDQLALQLAQLQQSENQRWSDQQTAAKNLRDQQAREDAQRAEDWAHQLYLLSARSSGGGGSGGGGSKKAPAPPKTGYDLAMNKLESLAGGAAYDADANLGYVPDLGIAGQLFGLNKIAANDDNATTAARLKVVTDRTGLAPSDAEYLLDQIPYGDSGTLGDLVLGQAPSRAKKTIVNVAPTVKPATTSPFAGAKVSISKKK